MLEQIDNWTHLPGISWDQWCDETCGVPAEAGMANRTRWKRHVYWASPVENESEIQLGAYRILMPNNGGWLGATQIWYICHAILACTGSKGLASCLTRSPAPTFWRSWRLGWHRSFWCIIHPSPSTAHLFVPLSLARPSTLTAWMMTAKPSGLKS